MYRTGTMKSSDHLQVCVHALPPLMRGTCRVIQIEIEIGPGDGLLVVSPSLGLSIHSMTYK